MSSGPPVPPPRRETSTWQWVAPLVALVALAFLPAPGAAQTSESVELASTGDTWVDAGAPDEPHGEDLELLARFEQGAGTRILLNFDFNSIEGAHIERATLKLTLTVASGEPEVSMAISGITREWEESVTWANQPPRSQSYGVQSVGSAPGEVIWDASALLGGTIEGKGVLHGIALSGPVAGAPPTYSRSFASRQAGEGVASLSVDYVPGAAVRESLTPESPSPVESPTDTAVDATPPGATTIPIALGVAVAVLLVAVVVVSWLRRRGRQLPE